jgi:hypothetical protein
VAEATKRGRATLAAARGDLALPEPEPKKKGRWLKRLAILGALAGIAVVVLRKLLGDKDADWQAARPTTPYVPSTPPAAPAPVATPDVADRSTSDDAISSPTESSTDTAAEDLVAADAVVADDAPADADLPTDAVEASAQTPVVDESGSPEAKYAGEGAYVGVEPPEGFFIKGNEQSMKYHTPESGGYDDTIAEVWFNSEEAAQEAGFVRAQG